LRALVVAAGTLVAGVGQLVVLASPLFDASGRRQGWHDKAARALVVDLALGADPARVRAAEDAATARLDGLLGQVTAVAVPAPAGGPPAGPGGRVPRRPRARPPGDRVPDPAVGPRRPGAPPRRRSRGPGRRRRRDAPDARARRPAPDGPDRPRRPAPVGRDRAAAHRHRARRPQPRPPRGGAGAR